MSTDQPVAPQQSFQIPVREPNYWVSWNIHCPKAHPEEFEAFKASNHTMLGITQLFCTQWCKDHPEEYIAFKAAHRAKYPPTAAPAVATANIHPSTIQKTWFGKSRS
jgi:hypothetical protein